MKCIFFGVLSVVTGCLYSVDFHREIIPEFREFDKNVYFVSELVEEPYIGIEFEVIESVDIFLNSELYYTAHASGEIEVSLPLGQTQLVFSCGEEYVFEILRGEGNFTDFSIDVGGVEYNKLDVTNESYVMVGSGSLVKGRVFSLSARHNPWETVNDEKAFKLYRGVNYLQLMHNGWAGVFVINKELISVDILSIEFLYSSKFNVIPWVSPEVSEYSVTPSLDSLSIIEYSLNITTNSLTFLTISSYNSLFINQYAISGDLLTNLLLIETGDTVVITAEDPEDSTAIAFYYLKIPVKSNNMYLSSLSLYVLPSIEQIPILASYTSLATCCTELSVLPFTENFHVARTVYQTSELEFYKDFYVLVVATPESSATSISLQISQQGPVPYLSSNKTVIFSPGTTELTLTLLAEDSSFSSIISVLSYMKSNDSSLSFMTLSGTMTPDFSPPTTTYRVYLDFYTIELQVTLSPSSHLATTFSTAPTTQTFSTLSFSISLASTLSTSLIVVVYAESRTHTTTYTFFVFRNDACGNGVRFTSSESCDDGNAAEGDGCSASCQIEANFTCSGGSETTPDVCVSTKDSPVVVPPRCGNSVIEDGEECELHQDFCGENCKKKSNGELCGDGLRVPDSTEECDDANDIPGDGCFECKIESGWECSAASLINNFEARPDECALTEDKEADESDWGWTGLSTGIALLLCLSAVGLMLGLVVKTGAGAVGWNMFGGGVYCLLVVQLLHTFETFDLEGREQVVFHSLGWSHFRFYGLLPDFEGEVAVEGDYLGNTYESLFINNSQYILLVFIGISLSAIWLYRYSQYVFTVFFSVTYIPVVYSAVLALFFMDFTVLYSIANYAAACIFLTLYLSLLPVALLIVWKRPNNLLYVLLTIGLVSPARLAPDSSISHSNIEEASSAALQQDCSPKHFLYLYIYEYAAFTCIVLFSRFSSFYLRTLPSCILLISLPVLIFSFRPFTQSFYCVSHSLLALSVLPVVLRPSYYSLLPAVCLMLVSFIYEFISLFFRVLDKAQPECSIVITVPPNERHSYSCYDISVQDIDS